MRNPLRPCIAPLFAITMIGACAGTSEPRLGEEERSVVSGATNVALAGTAWASSTYSGYPPANARDGNVATMWESGTVSCPFSKYSEDCPSRAYTTPTWLKVLFDTTKTVNEISINWPSSPRRYDVQYCPASVTCGDDGAGWVLAPGGSIANTTLVNSQRVFFNTAVQATAVRVVIYESWGYAQRAAVYELGAWDYPPEWDTGTYDCKVVCNSSSPWSTDCREEMTLEHTNCGQYGIYSGCASWCGGPFIRACSSSCTTPTGGTSTCGATGNFCVTDSMQQATPLCKDVCTYQSSYHHSYCKLYSWSNIVANCGEYGTYAPPEVIKGSVSTTGGSDVNRCARGIESQFIAMPTHGQNGAITYDSSSLGFTPSCDGHWQGIQRLPNDETRFVMSASRENDPTGKIALGAIPGGGTMALVGANAPIVNTRPLDTVLNHPGGMQALGDYVFVGLETAGAQGDPAYIQQFNTAPNGFVQVGGSYNLGPHGAAAVAITKLKPFAGEGASRFLMMVPRFGDSSVLELYLTPPGAALSAGLSNFYLASTIDMALNGSFVNGWMGFQNVNFVTECGFDGIFEGDLYLFGMANTNPWCVIQPGDDWMKLYKVSLRFDPVTELLYPERPALQMDKHVYYSNMTNLAAAAGIYVTTDNKLRLIATEHAVSSTFYGGIDLSEIAAP